jgi:hypothetical protein
MATECKGILGINKIVLYENKGVKFIRPDISKQNEVNFIWSGSENYVIDYSKNPTWQRSVNYSANYEPSFADKFNFVLFGNDNNKNINSIRKNRSGFIVEVQTVDGKSFIFPSPVFVVGVSEMSQDDKSWQVEMNYRQPTFKDYLLKLNTMVMTGNYILSNSNGLLISKENTILIWK